MDKIMDLKKWLNSRIIFIKYVFIVFLCFFLYSCNPGMGLKIKNISEEDVILKYLLCDDLINEEIEKYFEGIIGKDETVDVLFSWNNFYNRGVTQEDYKDKETFLSIFENMYIEKINSNEIISIDDTKNFDLEYVKKGVSTHIFILKIL